MGVFSDFIVCKSSHYMLLCDKLELEFYQKQLLPSLIPTIRSSYARQMKKVSKFRNLFCIVPLLNRSLTRRYLIVCSSPVLSPNLEQYSLSQALEPCSVHIDKCHGRGF